MRMMTIKQPYYFLIFRIPEDYLLIKSLVLIIILQFKIKYLNVRTKIV
jgi:hypothetical protein